MSKNSLMRSSSRLAHLEHILHHPLQPLGLLGEDGHILPARGLQMFLLQQLGITDNRGEGGLQVVGQIDD